VHPSSHPSIVPFIQLHWSMHTCMFIKAFKNRCTEPL
jgi:hypothetical protein